MANVGGGLSVITVDEYDTVVELNDSMKELDENVNVTSCEVWDVCDACGACDGSEVCEVPVVGVDVGQSVTSDTVMVVNRGVAEFDTVSVTVTKVYEGCPVGDGNKEFGSTVTVTNVKGGTTEDGEGRAMVSSE